MHYFSNLFDAVLYIFRTCPLSIIRSISTLYICNRYCHANSLASASVIRMDVKFVNARQEKQSYQYRNNKEKLYKTNEFHSDHASRSQKI